MQLLFLMLFYFSYIYELLSSVLSFLPVGLFCISCKACLLALNSFNFCVSGSVIISPSFLQDSFAGYRILGQRSFSFSSLNIIIPLFSGLWFMKTYLRSITYDELFFSCCLQDSKVTSTI